MGNRALKSVPQRTDVGSELRSQSHDCDNRAMVDNQSLSRQPQTREGPTTVSITVGMSGQEISIQIEANDDFQAVLERIHAAAGAPSNKSVRLSALGSVLETVEELREANVEGHAVYATYMKNVDLMSLEEVAEELACDEGDFKGHEFILLKLPRGKTARAVADYLWQNQVLLTSLQAETLFDKLLHKLGSGKQSRADLIVALHSFCVHQHHVWEPDDGMSECLWANMSWGGRHVQWESRRLTRGQMHHWAGASAVPRTSPDNFPQSDLCCLREVAKARRAQQALPLEPMVFVHLYENDWRKLQ